MPGAPGCTTVGPPAPACSAPAETGNKQASAAAEIAIPNSRAARPTITTLRLCAGRTGLDVDLGVGIFNPLKLPRGRSCSKLFFARALPWPFWGRPLTPPEGRARGDQQPLAYRPKRTCAYPRARYISIGFAFEEMNACPAPPGTFLAVEPKSLEQVPALHEQNSLCRGEGVVLNPRFQRPQESLTAVHCFVTVAEDLLALLTPGACALARGDISLIRTREGKVQQGPAFPPSPAVCC
jgi:hypothetical protein